MEKQSKNRSRNLMRKRRHQGCERTRTRAHRTPISQQDYLQVTYINRKKQEGTLPVKKQKRGTNIL